MCFAPSKILQLGIKVGKGSMKNRKLHLLGKKKENKKVSKLCPVRTEHT